MKVKRRDRAYYHGVVFQNPSVQETAPYGFIPHTLLLDPDRRQAMGLTLRPRALRYLTDLRHQSRTDRNTVAKPRLVQPEYTLCEHLSATDLAGTIAIVACDKPPLGTLAALLEHNQPAWTQA